MPRKIEILAASPSFRRYAPVEWRVSSDGINPMTDEWRILYSESCTIIAGGCSDRGDFAASADSIVRELALDRAIARRLSISGFDAQMNVIICAQERQPTFEVLPDAVRGVVEDHGQGIPGMDLVMQEWYLSARSEMRERGLGTGLGLPNIKRNRDDSRITSAPGVGATLTSSSHL